MLETLLRVNSGEVARRDLAGYAFLHELVRIRGHGRTFWAELESRMPDARRRRSRLREYSLALF